MINRRGEVFKAVLPLLNLFVRVPVCGLIAHYNASSLPVGPDRTPVLLNSILVKRLTLRGFIVTDFADQQADFVRDVSGWMREGNGLENAVKAFQGLFEGRNFGKLIVRVAEPNLQH